MTSLGHAARRNGSARRTLVVQPSAEADAQARARTSGIRGCTTAFATCEEALSVASRLIRGGVREHEDVKTGLILNDGAVIAVVSPRRS